MFNRSEVLEVIADFRAGKADDRVIDILLEYIELTNVKQKEWQLIDFRRGRSLIGNETYYSNHYNIVNSKNEAKIISEIEYKKMIELGLI